MLDLTSSQRFRVLRLEFQISHPKKTNEIWSHTLERHRLIHYSVKMSSIKLLILITESAFQRKKFFTTTVYSKEKHLLSWQASEKRLKIFTLKFHIKNCNNQRYAMKFLRRFCYISNSSWFPDLSLHFTQEFCRNNQMYLRCKKS